MLRGKKAAALLGNAVQRLETHLWPDSAAGTPVWINKKLLPADIRGDMDDHTPKTDVYVAGRVKSISGDQTTIELMDHPKNETVDLRTDEVRMENENIETNDMAVLLHSNNAAIISFLKRKLEVSNSIYSFVGGLLICLNPFKWLPLYGEEQISIYRDIGRKFGIICEESPLAVPHIFQLVQTMINRMMTESTDQAIVISGESGSGKTETARQVLQYLGGAAGSTDDNSIRCISQLTRSNVLTEAFGNCTTLRNNNSSRFGKWVDIKMNGSRLESSSLKIYMLELGRLDFQLDGERNFHLFYALIASEHPKVIKLGMKNVQDYKWLTFSSRFVTEGVHDKEDGLAVIESLIELYGDDGSDAILKIIHAVLLFGNIQIDYDNDGSKVRHDETLDKILNGIGISNFDDLNKVLTRKSRNIAGEIIYSPLVQSQAYDVSRTVAKSLYSELFDAIVERINKEMAINQSSVLREDDRNKQSVGILDIYGFEFFETNSLEQLLINYANEKLQQFFLMSKFKSTKERLASEGLDYSWLEYKDNEDVIVMLDGRNSLFSVLGDQSSQSTGNDNAFVGTANKVLQEPYIALKNPTKFCIQHQSGRVTYDIRGFVDKNRLAMPDDVKTLLKESSNPLISQMPMFQEKAVEEEGKQQRGKGRDFITNRFVDSISALLKVLNACDPHFVRCIKSNTQKKPLLLEQETVLGQCHSLSIFSAIDFANKGYAYEADIALFLRQHPTLCLATGININNDSDLNELDAIKKILEFCEIKDEHKAIGRTKLFLRRDGLTQLHRKTDAMKKKIEMPIRKLQQFANASLEGLLTLRAITEVVGAIVERKQKAIEEQLASETSKSTKSKTLTSSHGTLTVTGSFEHPPTPQIVVEKVDYVKKYLVPAMFASLFFAMNKLKVINYRRNKQAVVLQKYFRGWKTRQLVKKVQVLKMLDRYATKIQSAWRGYQVRSYFKAYRHLRPKILTIQSAWRSVLVRKGLEKKFGVKFNKLKKMQTLNANKQHLIHVSHRYKEETKVLRKLEIALRLQKIALPIILTSEINKMRYASVIIQSCFRGYIVRNWLNRTRMKYLIKCSMNRSDHSTKLENIAACFCYNLENPNHYDYRLALEKFNENPNTFSLMNKNMYKLLNDERSPRIKGWKIGYVRVECDDIFRSSYSEGWVCPLYNFVSCYTKNDPMNNSIDIIELGYYHTVIKTSSNQIFTYGLNDKSQCGGNYKQQNVLTSNSSQKMTAIWWKPVYQAPQGKTIINVQCGKDYTLFLLSDGGLYAFGNNKNGQCGCSYLHTIISRPKKVKIYRNYRTLDKEREDNNVDNDNIISRVHLIAAGSSHAIASILNNSDGVGPLAVWGSAKGLGINDLIIDIASPMILRGTEDKWIQLQAGSFGCYALNDKGILFQIGFTDTKSSIKQILNGVVKVSVCGATAVALLKNSKIAVWGNWDVKVGNSFRKLHLDKPHQLLNMDYAVMDIDACWKSAVFLRSDGIMQYMSHLRCIGLNRFDAYLNLVPDNFLNQTRHTELMVKSTVWGWVAYLKNNKRDTAELRV